jgi:hypothetical protein
MTGTAEIYEKGVAQSNLARAFHGNPYDGHTLREQLEQATILMQDSAVEPATVFVDMGYRGVDAQNPDVRIVHLGKSKRLSAQERKLLERRQAIEPIIGHLKADHRMDRCHLKGETACRAVRSRLQHPLAAAHDCQEGHAGPAGASFAPVAAGQGWGDIAQARHDALATGARMNISGTTR